MSEWVSHRKRAILAREAAEAAEQAVRDAEEEARLAKEEEPPTKSRRQMFEALFNLSTETDEQPAVVTHEDAMQVAKYLAEITPEDAEVPLPTAESVGQLAAAATVYYAEQQEQSPLITA